jgi:hypothetical protein
MTGPPDRSVVFPSAVLNGSRRSTTQVAWSRTDSSRTSECETVMAKRESIDTGRDRDVRRTEHEPPDETDGLRWSIYEMLRQTAQRQTRNGRSDRGDERR